jgi:C4-dicarboxylate transporter DctM subunit
MLAPVALIVVMLLALLIGVPIGWSLALSSLAAILIEGIPLAVLVQRMFTSMDSFTMIAVPCFLVAGDIMAKGSISKRLVDLADSVFGSLRGGLAIVAIVSCTIFASLTGSALATTAAIGGILYPAMTEKKYPKDFTSAVLAIGGTLGPIIPPSVVFIFYAQATEVSVLQLFFSGIGPGIASCIGMCIVSIYIANKRGFPKVGKFCWKNLFVASYRSILAMLMPLIILGGIYSGIFTATESAAVAVIYGLLISLFVYRDVNWRELGVLFKGTAKTTANLMILIAAANTFGYLVGYFNIPRAVSAFVMSYAPNKYVFLMLCGAVFLIAGMFMEAIATTVILAPILHPLAVNFGIHPVQFGCFMVFVLCLGIATPPFAPTMFVACGMSKEPVVRVTRQLIPFVIEQIGIALLIAFVPALSTFLPKLIMQ